MKVVDEKGKLFGKLNIIDLLVIILVVAALVVVGVKVLGIGNAEEEEGEGATGNRLTYTVRVTAQRAELAEWITEYVDTAAGKKDQLLASGKLVDAYIVDFWTEPTRYNRMGDGTVELYDSAAAAEAGLVDICFVIEATVDSTMTNLVGAQEVRVGKVHTVKTTHLEFTYGMVEQCTWE